MLSKHGQLAEIQRRGEWYKEQVEKLEKRIEELEGYLEVKGQSELAYQEWEYRLTLAEGECASLKLAIISQRALYKIVRDGF